MSVTIIIIDKNNCVHNFYCNLCCLCIFHNSDYVSSAHCTPNPLHFQFVESRTHDVWRLSKQNCGSVVLLEGLYFLHGRFFVVTVCSSFRIDYKTLSIILSHHKFERISKPIPAMTIAMRRPNIWFESILPIINWLTAHYGRLSIRNEQWIKLVIHFSINCCF